MVGVLESVRAYAAGFDGRVRVFVEAVAGQVPAMRERFRFAVDVVLVDAVENGGPIVDVRRWN